MFENLFENGLLAVLPTSVTVVFTMYLILKFLDFFTGLLKTFKDKENLYKSAKMRDGIVRWMAELAGIVFVLTIDIVLGINYLLCTATLGLFIYKEGGSILENLLICGVELPLIVAEKLDVFKQMNDKGDVK